MFSLMLEYYNLMIENDELDLEDDDIQDEGCSGTCSEDDEDLMDDSEVEEDIDDFGDL